MSALDPEEALLTDRCPHDFKLCRLGVKKTLITAVFAVGFCILMVMVSSRPSLREIFQFGSPSQAGNISWERRLPGALIIGVKKGGTRALLEYLRMHPNVRAPIPEIHFFDVFYERGLEWYRSQMPYSLPTHMTIEKSPRYFITTEAPARVHDMSPNIKLMIVVRDPVTRALSDYTHEAGKLIAAGSTPNQSFEEMVFANETSGLLDTDWIVLRTGIYVNFLEQWLRHFRLDQMHFVSGERLVSDPVSELDKVQNFLGLDIFIEEKHFDFNNTKGFPCMKIPKGKGDLRCLDETKGRTHPTVKPDTIQRLEDFYRPFNQRFYQIVGKNFGWP